MRAFKETQTVSLGIGAEILATDYKLSKSPLMQPFFESSVIVVEMSNAYHGLDAFLQLNDSIF